MKKLLLSAVALGMLFTACKKDDDNTPDNPKGPTKYFLNRVSETDSLSLTYDAANRLTKTTLLIPSEGYQNHDSLVYENGKLTKLFSSEESATALKLSQTFQYASDGKLVKANFYSETTGQVNRYDSVVYDANGRVAAVFIGERSSENGPLAVYTKDVFIWDTKGNIVKDHSIDIVDGTETKDTTTTTYTYDDKVNFVAKQHELYLLDPEEAAFALSANNFLTATTKYTNTVEAITNVYTYDADGYPVTQKMTDILKEGDQVLYSREENYKIRYISK